MGSHDEKLKVTCTLWCTEVCHQNSPDILETTTRMPELTIKHAGKVHKIEILDSDTGLALKQKIQGLTQIPIDRQKILIKGGKLNDDSVLSQLNINTKMPIMVLGTPDKDLPICKPTNQVFLEDLNQNQLVKISPDPSGLVNLGNTCYLNSSLQSIFQVKEIADKVDAYSGKSNPVVSTLKSIFGAMRKKQENVNPTLFLMQFRANFPQFAEQEQGFYKQQDAEEAFSQLLTVLNAEFDVEDLFRVDFKTETKCLALPDEEVTKGFESMNKLACHIDIKTNFLRDGLLNGLKDRLEKHNETLGQNAEYEVSKTITRLPKYLAVHFVRFFWKRDTNKKSKILRKVQFPFELDLAEMLDESIKQDKVSIRDKLHKIEKDNQELVRDFKKAKKDSSLTPQQQQEEDELKIESIKSRFQDDFAGILPAGFSFDTTTENPSSVYELSAIITHQGSSADSGHYQAFVRDEHDLDGDKWWKFNDNKVSTVGRDKIEQLAGGGESDSALILFYKAKGV